MIKVKDFLNPNSMLTPGIAASIIMINANVLWVNSGMTPKYAVLVLCLLICLIVLAIFRAPIWQKLVYYIINVAIVFSISAGSNIVDTPTNQIIQTTGQQVADSRGLLNVSSLFIESAELDNDITQ